MELTIVREGTVLTATVSGKFIADDAYNLLKRIEDESGGEKCHLILDVRKLEYIGSQGVSAVIKLAMSHHLRLVGLPPNVKKTLEALGMVKSLRVYQTVEQALKNCLSASGANPAAGHSPAATRTPSASRTRKIQKPGARE